MQCGGRKEAFHICCLLGLLWKSYERQPKFQRLSSKMERLTSQGCCTDPLNSRYTTSNSYECENCVGYPIEKVIRNTENSAGLWWLVVHVNFKYDFWAYFLMRKTFTQEEKLRSLCNVGVWSAEVLNRTKEEGKSALYSWVPELEYGVPALRCKLSSVQIYILGLSSVIRSLWVLTFRWYHETSHLTNCEIISHNNESITLPPYLCGCTDIYIISFLLVVESYSLLSISCSSL